MSISAITSTIIGWFSFSSPKNDDDRITVKADNSGKVSALVCEAPGANCKVTELFQYTGPNKIELARETAGNLQTAIHNRDLFEGALELENDESELIVDNSWIPFNTSTLIDLSTEGLSEQARKERIGLFISKLWTAGIMPPDNVNAQIAKEKLAGQVEWRNRDPKLLGYLILAGLHLQTKEYDQAASVARKIIDSASNPGAARPIYYDEAVFLTADVYRIQAMKSGDPAYLERAAALLHENYRKLRSEEKGYSIRYNYELLKTCSIYKEQFAAAAETLALQTPLNALCGPGEANSYYYNATFGLNLFSPAFGDNFIAVRSFQELARYSFSSGDSRGAAAQYDRAFKLLEFFTNTGAAVEGDPEYNWALFHPLMDANSRLIGAIFGKTAGLRNFAWKAAVDKTLRRFRLPGDPYQFESKSFDLFKAKTLHGKAQIELKKARFEQDATAVKQHLQNAEKVLERAFAYIEKVRIGKMTEFYFAAMFEEKYAYNQIVLDYAEVLFKRARLSPAPEASKLNRQAAGLLEKITPQVNDVYLYSQIVLGRQQIELFQTEDAIATFRNALGISQKNAGFPDIKEFAFHGILLDALASSRTLDEANQKFERATGKKLPAAVESIDEAALPVDQKAEIISLYNLLKGVK